MDAVASMPGRCASVRAIEESPVLCEGGRPVRRLVVKIGSALLVEQGLAAPRCQWLDRLACDLAWIAGLGVQPVVVSSGAGALGRQRLGLQQRLRLEEIQAAAAVGQILLAEVWRNALEANGLVAAQILVTPGDTEDRRRHLNARATINQLLHLGAIPVVNENDTVATDQIRFGDNDRLAARVAQMIGADLLILLSDIDGLYESDPYLDATARHIPVVERLEASILAMAGEKRLGFSSGGMVSKMQAARIAMQAGCSMIIASGQKLGALGDLLGGEPARHTRFVASATPLAARKRWIVAGLVEAGSVTVDAGAEAALRAGSSLLAAGVTEISGDFARGDLVVVRVRQGEEIARGLISYGSEALRRILGRHSSEIEAILGYWRGNAVMHRDDMAM